MVSGPLTSGQINEGNLAMGLILLFQTDLQNGMGS
jgi:hypothetical protein